MKENKLKNPIDYYQSLWRYPWKLSVE